MSLVLYYHPLASFCWKPLIALYENATPFEPRLVDLSDAAQAAAFGQVWPMRQFPVLRDEARDWTVPESSIIIEYLALHYPGRVELVPGDPDLARQVRMRDRFFDLHVQTPMQKIVTDRIRPEGKRDPFGVEQARATLKTALDLLESDIGGKTWAVGERFTMADCAAAPALFYADKVAAMSITHPHAYSYLQRLRERASFARVLQQATPYFAMFPG